MSLTTVVVSTKTLTVWRGHSDIQAGEIPRREHPQEEHHVGATLVQTSIKVSPPNQNRLPTASMGRMPGATGAKLR